MNKNLLGLSALLLALIVPGAIAWKSSNGGSAPKSAQVEAVDYVEKYRNILAATDPSNAMHQAVNPGSIDSVVRVTVPTTSLAQSQPVREEQALTLWQAWDAVHPGTSGLTLYSEAGQEIGKVWGGKVDLK